MSRKIAVPSPEPIQKREWRRPQVEELGHLRDFVRSGHAFGKSGGPADGSSSGNDESMV